MLEKNYIGNMKLTTVTMMRKKVMGVLCYISNRGYVVFLLDKNSVNFFLIEKISSGFQIPIHIDVVF